MAIVLANTGKAIVTNRVKNGATGATEPNFVAWGTGAGTAAIADTTLFTESSTATSLGTRTTGTSSQVTVTTTNDTYQVVGTMTSNATQTITNMGLFDAVSAGNLFIKSDFTGVGLSSGDSIQFTVKATFA